MTAERGVVVTGGAGALGRAVVAAFEAQGARVAVIDVSDEVMTAAFAERAAANLYLAADLTSRERCAHAVETIGRQFGRIDVLCNVAGGFLMGEPVHATSDKTWDFLFDLDARSVLNMVSAVVPVMLAGGGGKIVNVAARAGLEGQANMGAYTASKAAVLRITEAMAKELREQHINVNCVMPSLIDTPRNRADMPDADYSKWVAPADIASVISFLASDAARSVHGAAIPVDGLS